MVPPDVLVTDALLDAMPMAVVLIDGRRRIIGWNTAAEMLYGHSRRDAVGASALDVLFDDDVRSAARELLDQADRGRAEPPHPPGQHRQPRHQCQPVRRSLDVGAVVRR